MNDTKCAIYHLKTDSGDWLAQIVLTSDGVMYVMSDWGNFNVCWRAYKSLESFKKFLLSINPYYFANNAISSNSYIYGITKKTDAAARRFSLNVFVPFQKILIKEMEVSND